MVDSFPLEGEGFVCDVQHGKDHLRLFSAMNSARGDWTASVFDLKAKGWIEKDTWANDANEGKHKAEGTASSYLKTAALSFDWRKTAGW